MKTNMHHWQSRLVLILCFIFLISATAASQTIKGIWGKLDDTDVKKLLDMLKSEKDIVYAPEYFFKEVYNDQLPNLMFFIDKRQNADAGTKKSETEKNHKVNITLVKNNKERLQLFGERVIWVMVFVAESVSDKKSVIEPISKWMPIERKITEKRVNECRIKTDIETKEAIKMSPPLKVRLDSLEWRAPSGEFALFSIVKGVASAFGGKMPESKEPAKEPAEPKPLEMQSVGCHNGTRLSLGMVKFPLGENSINRISIAGFPEIEPTATFGNYSSSHFTSSIGMMWTRLHSITETGEEVSQNQVNPFMFAHIYLKRPQLPPPRFTGKPGRVFLNKVSVSFVIGTKLDDFLGDIFIGASFGNFLFENIGIVIGKNFRLAKSPDDGKKGKDHWALGFTFIF